MSSLNMLRLKKILRPSCATFVRNVTVRHSSENSKGLEHLNNRSLIKVAGPEAGDFLQGLITNDMRHFDDGAANIYALFLNIKGRVMCDCLIYKTLEKSIFYLECDANMVEGLQKHLKMYKLRRKVEIEPLANEMRVWSAFDACAASDDGDTTEDSNGRRLDGRIFPCGALTNKSSKLVEDIMIYEDPRIPGTSLRILSAGDVPRERIIKHLGFEVALDDDYASYKSFRYQLGIPEGMEDLPPGKAFPLELNSDYLHGVSFHKGCYIGQELTARTHHTGVVRKRVMPLMIENGANESIPYDENILNEAGKSVGKFRAREGPFGIGLMRITEALNARTLHILGCRVSASRPRWWPTEPHKDKVTADSGK